MSTISIGVANSVSANFDYDPIDTLSFAAQSDFDPVQIYLSSKVLGNRKLLDKIAAVSNDFERMFFHAEGSLNEEFMTGDYSDQLFDFMGELEKTSLIIHFDEQASIDKLIKLVDQLCKRGSKIYIENYFTAEGSEAATKNLKKFLALFTLASNFGSKLYPVLDIPRLFHQKTGFTTEESLEWCYQLLNFYGNRRIPILLHLIDVSANDQQRSGYVRLGDGYLPYDEIFAFIKKTRPVIEGVILEYEDKMNPLQSRDYLREILK